MDYKDLYKSRGNFSIADQLAKRYQNLAAERQEKQRELFWGARVALDELQSPKAETVVKRKNPRLEMLQKWKAEKMKKLEEEKKKQKPIFKVGIVQKKATGSPIINKPKIYLKKNIGNQQTIVKPQINNADSRKEGVLTRAKARSLAIKVKPEIKPVPKSEKKFNNKFYKIETGKKKQIDSHVFKVPEVVTKLVSNGLTMPYSPNCSKQRRTLKLNEAQVEVKATTAKVRKEVEVEAVQLLEKLKIKEPRVETERSSLGAKEFGQVEEQADANEKQKDTIEEKKAEEINLQPQNVTPEKTGTEVDDFQPIYYSPYVTVRSGRKSKRKSKKSLTLNVDEQIKKEENEFKCRIFSFRKYIECETKRLLETCHKWKHVYLEFQEVPAEIEGDIDSVIGKTNLLTSDKFVQFKGLIDRCEKGDPFVKVDDLQGFQDWVSIEVERIDEEFHKLEKRKCNNWKSETPPPEVAKAHKVKVAKNGVKKPVGKSNIRSHILAARKLLKEGSANGGEGFQVPETTDAAEKVTTPKKQQNLLREVLNSETKRKSESSFKESPVRVRRNSGLEIMIATHKNKLMTPVKLQKSPVLTDYKVIIEKEETPSRSILKKTPKTLSSTKGHVTFKKLTENVVTGGKGLSEKYFQPLMDDDFSPMRTILGDLGNLTPMGMKTRSKTRQMSYSALMSPQEKSGFAQQKRFLDQAVKPTASQFTHADAINLESS